MASETRPAPKAVAGPVLRGLRGRRRLPEPLRAHRHADGQHLVHVPDDEHEPDALRRAVRGAHAFGQPLVNSAFTLALVTGLTVPDTSENAAANLAWTDIKLPKPVFEGDTICAESEILEMRESKSNPSVGIVSMRCRGINQRREVVIEFRRTFMVYKRGAPEVADTFPRHRRRTGRSDGRRSSTIAEWATGLDARRRPGGGGEHAKLHVLDTLGCGLAAHASGVAREGRATMGELGGEPEATVIGSTARLPAANAAFANAMLCHGLDFDDTHSDSVSHVSTVIAPASLAAAEQLGAAGGRRSRRSSPATRSSAAVGMAASGAFHARGFHPTAICGIFGGDGRGRALTGLDPATTTSALGIAGSFAGGLFAYLDDGTATKPMHPAWAAHGAHLATRLAVARRRGAARRCSRASSGSTTPSSARSRARSTSTAQLADLGCAGRRRGSPTSRTRSATSCTARSARRRRRRGPDVRAATRSTTCSSRCRPPASRSCSSRPARRGRRARSTRASSRSSTRSRRCSSAVMSPSRDFTDEAIADPAVLAVAAKVRYETREYPTTRRRSRAASVVRLADGRASRRLPVPEGRRPRTRCRPTRCARSSARTRRSRSRRGGRGARGGDPRARGAGRPAAALAPLTLPRSRRRGVTALRQSTAEQQEIVAAVREFVDRDVMPVASELEHARRVPGDARRDDARAGALRDDDPGGVRRARARARHLRADRDRALARLGDAVGDPQRRFIAARMIRPTGRTSSGERFLPRLASGETPRVVLDDRAARGLRRPVDPHDAPSATATTTSSRGQKMWVTNGWRSGIVMLLAKTDPDADPPHTGMTGFIVEKEPEVSSLPGLDDPDARR